MQWRRIIISQIPIASLHSHRLLLCCFCYAESAVPFLLQVEV